MIINLVDKVFYFTGLATFSCLVLFWNKKLTWYQENDNSESYRKIIFFKYGIFPENVIYQKSKNSSCDWKIITEEEYRKDKKAPTFDFNPSEFNIDINLTSSKSNNYVNFYKKL
jgi:hypothetical protein